MAGQDGGRHGGRHTAPESSPGNPARPFVTAAQTGDIMSGGPPGTPPHDADRQRELYELVFEDRPPAPGAPVTSSTGLPSDTVGRRPRSSRSRRTPPAAPPPLQPSPPPSSPQRVWHLAVAGSAMATILALGGVAYATGFFGDSPAAAPPNAPPAGSAKPTKPGDQATSREKPLPTFEGTGSGSRGKVKVPDLGLTYARLGGAWQPDRQPGLVKQKYGMQKAHFNQVGTDQNGQAVYARVMSGPVADGDAGDLKGAAMSTAVDLKAKLYDGSAKGKQFATEPINPGGAKGHVLGFKIKQSGAKADTMVVAAVDAGKAQPSAVFILIPGTASQLRPDINTVIKSIKPLQ